MKFSIVIPIYNTEKYVETAILSVLNQTYSDYELICINDGSTDESEIILNRFADNQKIVIIKNDDNQGPLSVRLTGIKYAAGDYILFLDSDDWLELNALYSLSAVLKKNLYDYVEFRYYEVKNGIKTKNFFFREDKEKNFTDVLLSKANHTIWNKCFRSAFIKPIFEQPSGFFSIFNEDYYQMVIIEYYAKKRKLIHVPLYNYRLDSGITNTGNFSNAEKFKLIDISLNNVYENLCEFFRKESHEEYISYVTKYNDSRYLNSLKETNSKEVIDIVKKRFGEDGFLLLLLKEINNLDKEIKKIHPSYRLLSPITNFFKKLLKFLRLIRDYILERL